jgi:cytochrome c peroxidase
MAAALHRLLAGAFTLALGAALHAEDLNLEVTLRWRGAPLTVPSADLAGTNGQLVRVTRFAALVSGVSLARPDGSTVQLDGQYGLIDAERGRLTVALRNVPAGRYHGLALELGLPSTLNHADPSRWPARHPLNPIENGLHWGWSGGYVFAAIEGLWRNEPTGTPATPASAARGYSFHLATDRHRMPLQFTAVIEVHGPTTVALALDLGKMLSAHRFAPEDDSETTHSGEGDELASQLARGLQRAWFLLETKPTPALPATTTEIDLTRTATMGTPWAFVVPAGFPQPELPADNPLTREGIALGQRLFNDPRLSEGNRQSCADCHQLAHGFTDGQRFSAGVEGIRGSRNAMPLFNLAWSPAYGWDGARPRIRDQVRAAMTNPIEMKATPAAVIAELDRDESMRTQFAAAFGGTTVTMQHLELALEQYLLTLVSADSKFDRAARGETELTEEEQRGLALFVTEHDPARGRRGADCFHCHGGALFTDFGFRSNGLEWDGADPGRSAVTGRGTDRGKFKTPSLRNVALTPPYMHDGRFATLEEVVAHYDHGVQRTETLDPNLAKHPAAGLRLTPDEQRALVAFLRCL